MNAKSTPERPADDDLRTALRAARAEYAERGDALSALRSAEVARLEVLEDALRPIVAQAPHGFDMFDLGMTHGEKPRLFLDMVSFFELGRDRRTYAFFQDARSGRVKLAQSDDVSAMTRAATLYVARRLVERERALATEADHVPAAAPESAPPAPPPASVAASAPLAARRPRGARTLEFVVDFVGAGVIAAFIIGAGWLLWRHGTEWVALGAAPQRLKAAVCETRPGVSLETDRLVAAIVQAPGPPPMSNRW